MSMIVVIDYFIFRGLHRRFRVSVEGDGKGFDARRIPPTYSEIIPIVPSHVSTN
jgi:hypothetical protein